MVSWLHSHRTAEYCVRYSRAGGVMGKSAPPADQLLATRLHVSMRRPGVIAVRVRPTSHNCFPQFNRAVSHLLCVDHHRTCCDPSQLHHTSLKNARLQCPPSPHVMRRKNRHGDCPPEELPSSPRGPRPSHPPCRRSGALK